MFKPTFGQTNTPSGFSAFTGAANANPFGQTSVFGKSTNTAFAPPAFGASGSTSLFNNTLSTTNNLFRSSTATPTFGQPQTTQPSFGFGATPQPTTNLFGTQQNAGSGLFGSGSTSAFGASKPPFGTSFGTGTSTGLFGAQQPTQTSTSLFGQAAPSTGTGLFGASTGTFGASNQQTGTVIKFNPVSGTDSLVKNGTTQQVSTRHYCITCMKEYENKSLEELRLEDYMANRKGPQQSNLFGTPTQQPSLFGAPSSGTSLFGNPQTTENKTLFGQPNTSLGGFGTSGSNVFGSTPTATNSLFGNKPGFGTTTTTTPAFGFGSTSGSNLFGNTQNKSFGATTPQPVLFGQTPTQQNTGFGNNPGFSGFNTQQNQSMSLFDNKPATTFNLSTTTTSGFTFGSNTATSTGFFGAKPATSGFGTTPATGFGTTFGNQNTFGTSTATSTSVFKPTTTNFSIGSMQNTGGLGTSTLGNTVSLFGNTAQKPGGLFGSTSGTGMFGSTFGNTSNTFGSSNLSLGSSSTGGNSLFGNTSLIPSQPTSSTTHPAILALASVPFADSPLFKNLLPASGKTDSLLKPSNAVTQKAMLVCKDLKVSQNNSVKIKLKPIATPLTKKSLFEGLEESEVVSPSFVNTSSVKKLTLKPKTFNSSVISDSWMESASNKENQVDKLIPRRVSFTIPNESNTGEKDSFYIRRNPLFKPQRQNAVVDLEQTNLSANREGTVEDDTSHTDVNKSGGTPSNNTILDDTGKDSSKQSNSSLDETRGYLNDTSRYDEEWEPHPTRITLRRLDYYTIPALDDLVNLLGDDGSCIVDNFCIGRYGYGNLYFDETMDVAGLNIDEIVHFRHKEVNVYPDDDNKPSVGKELNRKCQVTLEQVWPVDKTTREPIKDPERLLKLKYEEKLRRSTAKMGATFIEYRPTTGSWVFKVEHFSKYGLTDSDDEEPVVVDENKFPPGIASKLKIPPSMIPPGQMPPPAQSTMIQDKLTCLSPPSMTTTTTTKKQNSSILSPILPPAHQTFTLNDSCGNFMGLAGDQLHEKSNYQGSEMGLDIDEEMDEEDPTDGFELLRSFDVATEHLSPSVHLARRTGIDSHRVQLMKASLFEEERNDEFDDVKKFDNVQLMDYTTLGEIHDNHLDLQKLPRGFHAFKSRLKTPHVFSKPLTHYDARMDIAVSETFKTPQYAQSFPILRPRPKTVNIINSGNVLPFCKSSLAKHSTRCASDSGIYMGRSFKVGWGPRSSLVSLTTRWNVDEFPENLFSFGGRSLTDNSPTAVQRLFLYNKGCDYRLKESLKRHLMIQLEHSNKGEEDGCPLMAPQSGVEALHAHCLLASGEEPQNSFELYCRQVWELCVALWGNLPTLSPEDDPSSHKTTIMRKEAVTEWLKKCVTKTIRKEVDEADSSKEPNKHIGAVLSLLSGREIEEACGRLQKSGDHFAALLLASGPSSKAFLQNQLSEWQNVGADGFIDQKRMKLFCLSSGLPLYSSTDELVNICEGLDWKRAFAVHFWYLLSPLSTIGDVIKKYEAAFEGPEAYACRPNPPYGEVMTSNTGRYIYDLCYHIIKLYCFKSHPLEQLLNPATYTSDPLDHRLSWLLEQTLVSLGYVHVSKASSAINCVGFASQLEAYGLWQWSVFVYLHIPDSFRRKQAILDTINRHVTLLEERELSPEEIFVVEELGIPTEWVYRGKATLALSMFRYHDAAYYLIQASEWNEVHQIIIKHIAADAIINENYEYLRDLLESLVPNATSISEWFFLGQLLWDYLEVNRVVQQALAEQDTYELEGRQAQISSVCARIVRWPCPTVKDRLCQAEIAKRMAHIYRNVMQLQGRKTQAEVTEVISKLPLPEDYLMEELRYIKEVTVFTTLQLYISETVIAQE